LDEVPTEDGSIESLVNDKDFSIAVEFPGDEEIRLMRIPRGNEWAFFDTFVSVKLGQDKWIAGFDDGVEVIPWQDQEQVPRPEQRVRIFWVKEEIKDKELEAREEKKREFTQAIISRPKPAVAHPEGAGSKAVPMQKMPERERQPLSPMSDHKSQQRSERFRQAKADLEVRMETDDFKKMRWVKSARKKGIPYFEAPPALEPIAVPTIDREKIRPIAYYQAPYEDAELMIDRGFLEEDWERAHVELS
jgi:hypothetical protein